jgi:hypothetical protein
LDRDSKDFQRLRRRSLREAIDIYWPRPRHLEKERFAMLCPWACNAPWGDQTSGHMAYQGISFRGACLWGLIIHVWACLAVLGSVNMIPAVPGDPWSQEDCVETAPWHGGWSGSLRKSDFWSFLSLRLWILAITNVERARESCLKRLTCCKNPNLLQVYLDACLQIAESVLDDR